MYEKGKGVLTLPDGTQINLPRDTIKSGTVGNLPSDTQFFDDFNDSTFDGSFNTNLWSLFDGVQYTTVEQKKGIMSFTKSSTDGGENGKIRSLQKWSLGEFSSVQAEMKMDPPSDGQMGNMVLAIEAVNPVVRQATWWTGCGIGLATPNPYFSCAQESV